MKYYIMGTNQEIYISDGDFLDAGREGKVYKHGHTACKIYFDKNNMIPHSKIMELKILPRPNIIKPEEILLDTNGIPVGFTMAAIYGHPLCKLFTNGFRNKYNIGNNIIQTLSKIIVDTVSSIHKAKCLIVDGNEMAYIVSKKFDDVFFIDVDSYKTPNFNATAFHPNTRDVHNSAFSELTDWFSVAIILCWLYVGVHPFRGKHPNYKKKGIDGLAERMKDNISIFNSNVRLAPTARDKSCIPKNYRDWFIDLFERGNRIPPPGLPGRVILTPVYTKIVKGTNNFDIILLKEFDGEILSFKDIHGTEIVTTKSIIKQSVYHNYFIDSKLDRSEPYSNNHEAMDIVLSKISLTPVYVTKWSDNAYRIGDSDLLHFGSSKFVVDNTVYIKNRAWINRIDVLEVHIGNTSKLKSAVVNSWAVLPNSSIMMNGFLYQRGLDKVFLYIPISSKNECMTVKVPELEDYRIVNGKYENNVCMLIGRKGLSYNKIILRFTDNKRSYDCRVVTDVDIDSINFAVLDNGVCASMEDTNTIELFRNIPTDSDLKSITDPAIKSSMKLWKNGTRLLFSDNNKLYIIKMKRSK